MILGFGEDLYKKWGLDNEAQLFFVLRWQELFDNYTYDSWQVRSCNLLSILDELLICLDMAETAPSSFNSIQDLIKEAKAIAGRDQIVKEHYPTTQFHLNSLEKLVKKADPSNVHDLNSIRRHIGILTSYLSSYRDTLSSQLKAILSNPPEKYKIQLYGLAMGMAVELRRLGYSRTWLRNTWKWVADNNSGAFESRLSRFLSSLQADNERDYTCFFPLRLSTKKIPDQVGQHWQLIKASEISYNDSDATSFKTNFDRSSIAKVTCRALDPFAAVECARREVERGLAAIRLFQYDGEVGLHPAAKVLARDSSNKGCLTELHDSRIENLRNPSSPQRHLKRLFELLDRLSMDDENRLGAVLQYHRLAMAARTDEVVLVNLWVALECLARVPGMSVIKNVCELIPPSVASHHIQGVVRNLAIDFRKAWRHQNADVLRQAAGCKSEKTEIPLEKLLAWLLQDDACTEIQQLYSLADDNPLMVFRLDRIQHGYVCDHDTFSTLLSNHRRHIDWQVQRIYRARNLLVHWGRSTDSIRDLVQHLHAYLVLTLHNIFNDIRRNPQWGVIEALEHRKLLYEYFVDSDSAERFTLNTLLEPAGLLKKQHSPEGQIWQ